MMKNKATSFFILVMGAAIGTTVTWRYFKEKYRQIAQEEIDSVKEVFLGRESNSHDCVEDKDVKVAVNMKKEKPDIAEYEEKLHKHGYTDYACGIDLVSGPDMTGGNTDNIDSDCMDKPYVISPDEFGEFYDYGKISLIYYADQILADDNDELVDDIEEVVGFESLTHFGDYEDDSVFVRNDRLKCDYEVLLDQRNYSDVISKKPHQI